VTTNVNVCHSILPTFFTAVPFVWQSSLRCSKLQMQAAMSMVCKRDLPIFFLSEDGDSGRLKHSDLNQSAVRLYWLPIIKSNQKQLQMGKKMIVNNKNVHMQAHSYQFFSNILLLCTETLFEFLFFFFLLIRLAL